MSSVMTISAKVPADLVDALRAQAANSDRTMSAELRRAIRNHVSQAPAARDDKQQ